MSLCTVTPFSDYELSVPQAFDSIGAAQLLPQGGVILLKPNLVDAIAPPVTTPVECIEAAIRYVRQHSRARIVVAEGSGSRLSTADVFSRLGYNRLATQYDVELVDLNNQALTRLEISGMRVFPAYFIPTLALESYIITVPVLKAHSLSTVTLALKSMMGFAPPSKYQVGGHWKKSFFHRHMEEAIIEMNLYRRADMVLIDASVGMAEYHLGGKTCEPPVRKLIAGTDPVETDKVGAKLLGNDWHHIPHIASFPLQRPQPVNS